MTTLNEPATPLGLPSTLFWDVNPEKLDVERSAPLIIARVVELGMLEDWRRVRAHYGDARMIQVVTKLRDLHPQGVSLCCAAFGLTREDFRCCTARPFPPAPWIY